MFCHLEGAVVALPYPYRSFKLSNIVNLQNCVIFARFFLLITTTLRSTVPGSRYRRMLYFEVVLTAVVPVPGTCGTTQKVRSVRHTHAAAAEKQQ